MVNLIDCYMNLAIFTVGEKKKTNISLITTHFLGSVFCLFSVEVNEQREAYELEQAKKGAQENF